MKEDFEFDAYNLGKVPMDAVYTRKPKLKFVAVKNLIMRGSTRIGEMCSATMAKRTAKALNNHQPDSRGV